MREESLKAFLPLIKRHQHFYDYLDWLVNECNKYVNLNCIMLLLNFSHF